MAKISVGARKTSRVRFDFLLFKERQMRPGMQGCKLRGANWEPGVDDGK